VSQTDIEPLSRAIRVTAGPRFRITLAIAEGADSTLPSKTCVPSWSRIPPIQGEVAIAARQAKCRAEASTLQAGR
jgi:hypothetical protein